MIPEALRGADRRTQFGSDGAEVSPQVLISLAFTINIGSGVTLTELQKMDVVFSRTRQMHKEKIFRANQ